MIKPFAITLGPGSSRSNHTGAWRTQRPVYVSRLAPCTQACPAGENPQAWLFHAESGDYRRAWEALVLDNPLPAVMGRACYHPCEGACNRGHLDASVGIRGVERFLGDLAITEGWALPVAAPPTGKRVLIVGAGPSGLSAAYQLRRLGHHVTMRDAGRQPGGLMRTGIPRYRLPRPILDAEIARILALGVELQLETPVDDLQSAMRDGGFGACFAAIGAHLAKRVDIPAADACHIFDALSLLSDVEAGARPALGRRVVVCGGGDTALDVARTARRLGAQESLVIYRRTQAQMPAHAEELREALDEGIEVRWLRTVTQLDPGQLTLEKMRLDADGRAQPTGELETIAADSLVLALGQEVDLTPLARVSGVRFTDDGSVVVGADLMTGCPGLFCGGDMVPATRSIAVAVGHGRRAALHIDAYLRGTTLDEPVPPAPAGYERLNTWYYTDAERRRQPVLDALRRQATFDEIHDGLTTDHALLEARRCLSCGNCFECDNCFGVCPDNAVIKLGPGRGFAIDYDFCKGCGLCAKECPCGAIDLVPEDI